MGRRDGKADRLMEIAERLADTPQELDSDKTIHKALRGADAVADLAILECHRVLTMTTRRARARWSGAFLAGGFAVHGRGDA